MKQPYEHDSRQLDILENATNQTIIQLGTLYIQNAPHYIVEMVAVDGRAPEFVTVYKAQKPDKPIKDKSEYRAIKAYTEEKKVIGTYKDNTLLGKLAKQREKPKVKLVRKEEEPLFMADLLTGKDTFTGKEGLGFYELTPHEVVYKATGVEYKQGEPTGVFINLDSIIWEKTKVPLSSLVKEYRARETLFLGL